MAYFDSQNGWIHLLFADEQDYYYMPSLVKVSMKDYMVNKLHEAGYQIVLKCNMESGEPVLKGFDEVSEKYLSDTFEAKGILKLKSLLESGGLGKKIYSIFTGSEKVAVIIELKDFHNIFSAQEEYAQLLQAIKNRQVSKSIMVVTAPLLASESNYLITSPESVLRNICDPVAQVVKSSAGFNYNLYQTLKNNMGERCVFFNEMSKENLKNIVVRNFQIECSDEEAQERVDKIDDIVTVLYNYYHLSYSQLSLNGYLDIGLSRNPGQKMSVLDAELQDTVVRKRICEFVSEHGQKQYSTTYVDKCPVYTKSERLVEWEGNEKEIRRLDNGSKEIEDNIARISHCLEYLEIRGDGKKHKEHLDAIFTSLYKSLGRDKSSEFREKKIELLKRYLECSYERDEAWRNKIWPICEGILSMADQGQMISDKVKALQKDLEETATLRETYISRFDVNAGYSGEQNNNLEQAKKYSKMYEQNEYRLDVVKAFLEDCRSGIVMAMHNLEESTSLDISAIESSLDAVTRKRIEITNEVIEMDNIHQKEVDKVDTVISDEKDNGDYAWYSDIMLDIKKQQL